MRTSDFAQRHITGEGLRQVGVYRHFYRAALQRIVAAEQAYREEVDAWYTTGDGRPSSEGGRGYTFPHCIHGSSRWTDYDNICGGCEDGYGAAEMAIGEARTAYIRFVDFFDWMSASPAALPEDIRKQIAEFSVSLFPQPLVGRVVPTTEEA
jgi:hypothetical protein